MRLVLDPDFLQRIHARAGEAHRGLYFPADEIPLFLTQEHTAELIEAAYLASMTREEGRLAQFTATAGLPFRARRVPFAESTRLTAENVRRIFPALSRYAFLDVEPSADGLRIVGIALARGVVSTTALGPGELSIVAGKERAAILGNEARFVDATLDLPRGYDLRDNTWMRVVAAIRQRGHGGMLIVLPENAVVPSDMLEIGRRFEHSWFALWGAAVMHQRHQDLPEERLLIGTAEVMALRDGGAPYDAASHILFESVVSLAGTDGAIVFDSRGALLGFAAIVRASGDPTVEVRSVFENDDTKPTKLVDLGGTRHQSAAKLVNAYHDAIVFVISEDGPVRLLRWENDAVLCVNRVELLF